MRRALVFNDTAVQRHHGCNAVMETLTGGMRRAGVETAWLWPVSMDWRRRRERFMRMPADIVVVNGEGTIHHTAERKRARQLVQLAELAEEKNVPAVLANATLEALAPAEIEGLRRFSAIFVRESRSHAYLGELDIASTLVPDLSLGVDRGEERPRDGLLVTDSVRRPLAGKLHRFADVHGGRYEAMQHRPGFGERMGTRVLRGLPGHLMGRSSFRRTADFPAFIERLRGAEAVVTGRFHTVLLCLLTDTPVLAVASNTSKIEATLGDALGDASRMVSADDLASGAAAERLKDAAYSEAELGSLARYRERAREGREHFFEAVAALAAGQGERT